jgi:glc operon protein GlcG
MRHRALVTVLLTSFPLVNWGLPSRGQTRGEATDAVKPASIKDAEKKFGSDVQDKAGLFEPAAVEAGRNELRRLERETNVATVIRTVETLKGEAIGEAAVRAARAADIQGIFILISRNEKELEIRVSKKYLDALTRPRRDAIRSGFLDGFRRRDYGAGLKLGVSAIAEQLAAAQRSGALAKSETLGAVLAFTNPSRLGSAGSSPLVVRNQVRLGLAGARAIIAGSQAKAQAIQLKVNIAVVDDGGHLLAFERMDGARPASGYTAITKATTAATFRQATGPLPAGSTPADPLLNLSLQNAAHASGGKITTLYGGVPVVVDGQCIGGVGIGGGSGEQDAQIARAGVQALVEQLAKADRAAAETKAVEKVD